MTDLFNILKNHTIINGNKVHIEKECSEDTWKSIKRCFQAFRAKWEGGNSQNFIFPVDPSGFIHHVIDSGTIPQVNPFSYYPTDDQSAKDTLFEHTIANPNNWSYLERKIRILEPSAGEGSLALDILRRFNSAGVEVELILCEIDPLNVLTLEAQGLSVHQGDFLKQSFDNIDLVIMNPPFEGAGFLKHIRHAQGMLNPKGALVSIIPTAPLKEPRSSLIADFRDECTLYNVDPLTLEAGTFKTAKTTQTRIIETRHIKQVMSDINDKQFIINGARNLALTLENDGGFHKHLQHKRSLDSISILVNHFTVKNECAKYNYLCNKTVKSIVALAFFNDIDIADAYDLHTGEKVTPTKNIQGNTVKPQHVKPEFHDLLFA